MDLDQFDMLLYDMYQMDAGYPPNLWRYRENFEKESYSQWALEELKDYIKRAVYPQNYVSIDELIEFSEQFIRKMLIYSLKNKKQYELFSISKRMAENVRDLLLAMK